jgi:hypothetical protein
VDSGDVFTRHPGVSGPLSSAPLCSALLYGNYPLLYYSAILCCALLCLSFGLRRILRPRTPSSSPKELSGCTGTRSGTVVISSLKYQMQRPGNQLTGSSWEGNSNAKSANTRGAYGMLVNDAGRRCW